MANTKYMMLSNMPLSGSLPPSFRLLNNSLKVLDLSNCSFAGDLSNLVLRGIRNLHIQVTC